MRMLFDIVRPCPPVWQSGFTILHCHNKSRVSDISICFLMLVIICLTVYRYPMRYEVACHWGFSFLLKASDSDFLHIFISQLHAIWGEMSEDIICLLGGFIVKMVSFFNIELYFIFILNAIHAENLWFINILKSHSVAFFTLLIDFINCKIISYSLGNPC